MQRWRCALLALGSNMGHRPNAMRSALRLLRSRHGMETLACSALCASPPLDAAGKASSPPDATTEQVAPAPPPPGEVAISPGGVTTAVGAPAESTEDDYFQACMAARTWMEQRGDDLRAQIEPYLAMVQSTQSAGPATFGAPWSELSAGQQSAVIVAVEAAADRMCG